MGLGSVFVRILFAVTLAERGRRGKIVVERRGEGERLLWRGEGRVEEGLFMATAGPQPASVARAARGDGQGRVARGAAHSSCVPVGLGLEQGRRAALCGQKAPSALSLAGGRAAERPSLDPPRQGLHFGELGFCSLLAWGAVIAEGFEFLVPCRAVVFELHFVWKAVFLSPDYPSGLAVFPALCSERRVLSSRLL